MKNAQKVVKQWIFPTIYKHFVREPKGFLCVFLLEILPTIFICTDLARHRV